MKLFYVSDINLYMICMDCYGVIENKYQLVDLTKNVKLKVEAESGFSVFKSIILSSFESIVPHIREQVFLCMRNSLNSPAEIGPDLS